MTESGLFLNIVPLAVNTLLSSVLQCLDSKGKKIHQQQMWCHLINVSVYEFFFAHLRVYIYMCVYVCVNRSTNLIGNDSRTLHGVLNKSSKQHPTKQQLYSYQTPISQTLQVRRATYAAYCRWSMYLLHGQDLTQGQFLNGVQQFWIQSFPCPTLVAIQRLKSQAALLFTHSWREIWMHTFPKSISAMWNTNSCIQDILMK